MQQSQILCYNWHVVSLSLGGRATQKGLFRERVRSRQTSGTGFDDLFGGPAIVAHRASGRPVTLRPRLSTSLPLSNNPLRL